MTVIHKVPLSSPFTRPLPSSIFFTLHFSLFTLYSSPFGTLPTLISVCTLLTRTNVCIHFLALAIALPPSPSPSILSLPLLVIYLRNAQVRSSPLSLLSPICTHVSCIMYHVSIFDFDFFACIPGPLRPSLLPSIHPPISLSPPSHIYPACLINNPAIYIGNTLPNATDSVNFTFTQKFSQLHIPPNVMFNVSSLYMTHDSFGILTMAPNSILDVITAYFNSMTSPSSCFLSLFLLIFTFSSVLVPLLIVFSDITILYVYGAIKMSNAYFLSCALVSSQGSNLELYPSPLFVILLLVFFF